MPKQKAPLDPATTQLLKRMLAMPPKPHDEMKVGRPANTKKKRGPKGRAASSKPSGA